MSNLLLMRVGAIPIGTVSQATSSQANPQLLFLENFDIKAGSTYVGFSLNTLSLQAINIPLSISFSLPVFLVSRSANNATRSGSATFNLGLYSSTNSVLAILSTAGFSLGNSASATLTWGGANASTLWVSMATSATQNITPGTWYFAVNVSSNSNGAGASLGFFGNSSMNIGNAAPAVVRARMTASTGALPSFIATSDLDLTGSDATRQPYIVLTA